MAEDRLVPGEEGAEGEVCLPGDEVGGGLPDHAPGGEQGRHLQGQGGAQGGGGVTSGPLTPCAKYCHQLDYVLLPAQNDIIS